MEILTTTFVVLLPIWVHVTGLRQLVRVSQPAAPLKIIKTTSRAHSLIQLKLIKCFYFSGQKCLQFIQQQLEIHSLLKSNHV